MTTYDKVKEWRLKNPEKVAEHARRYAKRHPETNKRAKAKYRLNNLEKIRESDKNRQRARRKADPEGTKRRMEHFKIRKEAKLWDIAGRPRAEVCEICAIVERTVFDHCHATGLFRGWICDKCNKILGLVKDSPEHLLKLANYLEDFMNKLTTKERNKLPNSAFAGPHRSYPVQDKSHAANAKARASQAYNKGLISLSAEQHINAKADKILSHKK